MPCPSSLFPPSCPNSLFTHTHTHTHNTHSPSLSDTRILKIRFAFYFIFLFSLHLLFWGQILSLFALSPHPPHLCVPPPLFLSLAKPRCVEYETCVCMGGNAPGVPEVGGGGNKIQHSTQTPATIKIKKPTKTTTTKISNNPNRNKTTKKITYTKKHHCIPCSIPHHPSTPSPSPPPTRPKSSGVILSSGGPLKIGTSLQSKEVPFPSLEPASLQPALTSPFLLPPPPLGTPQTLPEYSDPTQLPSTPLRAPFHRTHPPSLRGSLHFPPAPPSRTSRITLTRRPPARH